MLSMFGRGTKVTEDKSTPMMVFFHVQHMWEGVRKMLKTKAHQRGCADMFEGIRKMLNTKQHQWGCLLCSACVVLWNNAGHKMTSSLVSFCAQRVLYCEGTMLNTKKHQWGCHFVLSGCCRGDGMTPNTKRHPCWSLFGFGMSWVCSRCVKGLWTRDEGGPSSSVN